MPTSKNASWGFVGEANRREINQKVKWLVDRQPDAPEAREVKEVLDRPPPRISPIPKHMLPEGAVVAESPQPEDDGKPRPHRHRHHRKGCPRHEQRRRERAQQDMGVLADASRAVEKGNPMAAMQLRRELDAAKLGYTKASQEVGADIPRVEASTSMDKSKAKASSRKERTLKKLLAEDEPTMILPDLFVPGVVGKGMAMFLSGSFTQDPHMYDRRNQREHPDFRRVARAFDVTAEERFHSTPTPATGSGSADRKVATAPLQRHKLLALPTDKSHCRLKDEVKAHLELACTSGKTMMRTAARK